MFQQLLDVCRRAPLVEQGAVSRTTWLFAEVKRLNLRVLVEPYCHIVCHCSLETNISFKVNALHSVQRHEVLYAPAISKLEP